MAVIRYRSQLAVLLLSLLLTLLLTPYKRFEPRPVSTTTAYRTLRSVRSLVGGNTTTVRRFENGAAEGWPSRSNGPAIERRVAIFLPNLFRSSAAGIVVPGGGGETSARARSARHIRVHSVR